MDFRELLGRYNRPGVMLYLDPTCLRSGKIYRHNFSMDDFHDLKPLIDNHHGTYLMNLSMRDQEMVDIFWWPDLVTEHFRPTTIYDPLKENRWEC